MHREKNNFRTEMFGHPYWSSISETGLGLNLIMEKHVWLLQKYGALSQNLGTCIEIY